MSVSRGWWCAVVALGAGCVGCAGLASSRAVAPGRLPSAAAMPAYPAALQAAGVEGEVEFDLPVDAAGAPAASRVRMRRSSHALFRTAVLDAVRQWRFAPARRHGRAVGDSVRVHWQFVLEDHDCPPPAFPHQRCNAATADTVAAGAPQHATVESRAAGAVVGTTTACAVRIVYTACVGASSRS